MPRVRTRDTWLTRGTIVHYTAVFEWSPVKHNLLPRRRYRLFQWQVLELFMIRDKAESTMVWLPNELMFEICCILFHLTYEEAHSLVRQHIVHAHAHIHLSFVVLTFVSPRLSLSLSLSRTQRTQVVWM